MSAPKCQYCNNPTWDPSGTCIHHRRINAIEVVGGAKSFAIDPRTVSDTTKHYGDRIDSDYRGPVASVDVEIEYVIDPKFPDSDPEPRIKSITMMPSSVGSEVEGGQLLPLDEGLQHDEWRYVAVSLEDGNSKVMGVFSYGEDAEELKTRVETSPAQPEYDIDGVTYGNSSKSGTFSGRVEVIDVRVTDPEPDYDREE